MLQKCASKVPPITWGSHNPIHYPSSFLRSMTSLQNKVGGKSLSTYLVSRTCCCYVLGDGAGGDMIDGVIRIEEKKKSSGK